METFLTSLLTSVNGIVAYGVVFGVLVACGLGVPLPEDISLITGGFLAYIGAVNLPIMMGVGFFGILVGDSLIFLAGRRLSQGTGGGGRFFNRIITVEKRRRVEQLFIRHGEKIVMLARFLPGVRAVTYFTAGSARMGYFRFICWDGVAALVSAPLFVYLGYRFGDELELLIQKIRRGQFGFVAALAVIVGGYFLISRLVSRSQKMARRRRDAATAQAENSHEPRIGKAPGSFSPESDEVRASGMKESSDPAN